MLMQQLSLPMQEYCFRQARAFTRAGCDLVESFSIDASRSSSLFWRACLSGGWPHFAGSCSNYPY